MPVNIEIKARVRDPEGLLELATALCGGPGEVLEQEDIFFNNKEGRLKLRSCNGRGELIFYDRPDDEGPAESRYQIAPVADVDALAEVLGAALGVRAIVRKRRRLLRHGQTRIHLDRVSGLGHFMELEVVLEDRQSAEEGEAIARTLMDELMIREGELLACAYVDLLGDP